MQEVAHYDKKRIKTKITNANETKITKVSKIRASKNSKNPTGKAWDEKEK